MSGASDDEPASLDAGALKASLSSLRLGQPLIYRPTLDSTNTHAIELARAGASEGTLVIADEQTAGRGRVGRVWCSLPRRQLLLSLVLRPDFPPHFLVMAAALAVARTVDAEAGALAEIKWPNDVLHEGHKLCGILIETGSDARGERFAVLGIGLNVNGSVAAEPELRARATTLASIAGHDLPREQVAATLLTHLDALNTWLRTGGTAAQQAVREAWRTRLVTLGSHVRLTQGERMEEGTAEDVDADGALLLRRAEGSLLSVTWGDVS